MIHRRSCWSFVAGIWFAVIAAHGQSSTQTIVLPPVGLGATETAQISVMSSAAGYPGWSFVTTCQVAITFYDRDGSALSAPTTFTVAKSAQIFVAELPYASTGAKGSSTVVSAQLALTPSPSTFSVLSPPVPPCAVVFSLEIHDTTTGIAHVLVAGQAAQGTKNVATIGAVSASPCPGPSTICELLYAFESTPTQFFVLPPVGLSPTEAAQIDIRSSAASYAGSSAPACQASVAFYGADGSTLAAPASFTLEKTAQVFSAQLPYAATGMKTLRPSISAQISLTAISITTSHASAIMPCTVTFSLRTYDTATGVTHAIVTGESVQGSMREVAAGTVSAPARNPRPSPGAGLGINK